MTMQDRFKFRFWRFNDVEKKWKQETFADLMSIDGSGLPFDNTEGGAYTEYDTEYITEQCTGLKDKNGKLIYEGDIIEDKYGEKYIVKFGKHTVTIPVGYENGETECWGMYLSKFTYGFIYLQEQCDNLNPDNEYLIIGNIHENPDLLENKDE